MDNSKTIRIGIDGRALQGSLTGIGRYVLELCKVLDRTLPSAQFFVYTNKPVTMPVNSDRWILRQEQSSPAKGLKSVLWVKLRCGHLCNADNLDVFWGPTGFLPRLPRNVRTVVTVHDLNHILVPETMSYTHLWSFRLFFARDVARANKIMTNSHGTSQRLHKLVGKRADSIVYPGVDQQFSPKSGENLSRILQEYKIDFPYILSVATWEPRKNIESLLKTFMAIKQEYQLPHKLVLVGGRGWKDSKLVSLVGDEGRSVLAALGYVKTEHLPFLYSGAAAFVFPSLYEGFGMPVLEARACGTKVVTTDTPELREAGGEHSIYIQPNPEGIRQGIFNALKSEHSQSPAQKLPTWEQSAAKVAALLLEEAATAKCTAKI